ncbi:hypothetical protein P8C59_001439 [Phyllachora maydis]|uniref:Obg family GTPase CgtA n=1 Tax=Phyllachora maydis TaxID=1825666 RepID=A0AAD9MCA4_9PEZI|nr:hypothetical protein P8C59_001439 [Phyllachora maydis]
MYEIPSRGFESQRKLSPTTTIYTACLGGRHLSTGGAVPGERTRLNPAPDDYSRPYFADKAKLNVFAGSGGHGCISFHREAYLADGPANGGDGGHGGNVYIQAVHGETSLHKLARRRFVRAGKGTSGQGSARGGQRGEDQVITVPVGTVVTEVSRSDPEAEAEAIRRSRRRRKWSQFEQAPENRDPEQEPLVDQDRHQWIFYPGISSSEAQNIELPRLPFRDRLFAQPQAPIHLDLSRPTPRPILLAAGGLGGLGNPHFVSKDRPKPMFATRGEQAIEITIELELKLLADVGFVGLPNAGKSTLLRALSNSRARVGSWAFTTLQPNVGTVVLDSNKGRPVVTSFRRQAVTTPHDPYASSPDAETEVQQRTRFTIADIPGLIEGAHLDKGLGIAFLRHVERAGVLAFVVDLGAGHSVEALKALWHEVGLYAQMREEEEQDRERQTRIDWSAEAGTGVNRDGGWPGSAQSFMADFTLPPANPTGLHIAAKPWFVIATKGDLPDTESNFVELRDYMAAVTRGDVPHPSGIEGAWTRDCAVIP